MSAKLLQFSTKGSGVKSHPVTKAAERRAREYSLERILLAITEDRLVDGVSYRGITGLSMQSLYHELRIAAMLKDHQLVGKFGPTEFREAINALVTDGKLEIMDVSNNPHVAQFNARRIVAPEANQPQPHKKTDTCRRVHVSGR